MNKIYTLIWNASLNTWMVCSELAKKGKTKTTSSVTTKTLLPTLLIATASTFITTKSALAEICEPRADGSVWSTIIPPGYNVSGCELESLPETLDIGVWGAAVRVVGSGNIYRTITITGDLKSDLVSIQAGLIASGRGEGASYIDARGRTIEFTTYKNSNNLPQFGAEASWGSTIDVETLKLTMNDISGGSNQESYGVLAGSSTNQAETSALNGRYSYINVDNLDLRMNATENRSLLAGIRAIQGAGGGTSEFQGSSGFIRVNNKLDIDIQHLGTSTADATGIYISGGDSQVHLKDSHIKILSPSTRANAILIGKTNRYGKGAGSLYSTGDMILDTSGSERSYGAISILHQGALIDANADTSRTTIKSASNGIRVAGTISPIANTPIQGTKTLFNNLVIETSKDSGDLVNVTTYQPDYELSVRGKDSNLTAAKDGYILNVAGTSERNHSGVTFNFNDGYMQGLVNKTDVSNINMQLNQSTWQLAESNARNEAKFNQLSLTDAHLFAFDLNKKTANQPSSFILSGDVSSNASFLDLKNGIKGDLLTINGDYTGSNGVVILDTELNDDLSQTDKLIITGNASGSTQLQVNNIGGVGAQTNQGIQVIQTGSSESNTTFYLKDDYINLGAFDYSLNLKQAEQDPNGNAVDNWYLESKRAEEDVYTPGIGSYLANATMANNLFNTRLEDREGASRFQNDDQPNGSAWIRAYGGHHEFKSTSDQLKTKGDSFVTQAGIGLLSGGNQDQYDIGVMGGYAEYDGKTQSALSGRQAKANLDGYSVGLYGTWHSSPVEKKGGYVDAWVLWNDFNNQVSTTEYRYKYDASGITASIEAGGDYLLKPGQKHTWWLQPQAQLTYQDVQADTFKDARGVDIRHGDDNLQARIGLKTYLEIPSGPGAGTSYRPYFALNYIHNTSPYAVAINEVRYDNESAEHLGEVKLGVEGYLTKNHQLWINGSYVVGEDDHKTYQGNLGWKFKF